MDRDVTADPHLPPRRTRSADAAVPLDPTEAATLIADLATALARARADDLDAEVDRALHLVGVGLGLESLTVALAEGQVLRSAGDWRATGWMDPPIEIDLRRASWLRTRLEAGEEVTVPLLPRLPADADHERELFAERGVAAFAVVPVVWGQELGCLIAEAGVAARTWSAMDLRVLDALASAVAAAYERRAYHRTLVEEAKAARDEVQRANRFLALFAHELRSPLTAIVGYADMLATGMAGPLGQCQTEYLGDILDSARALGGLLDSGLDLARIDEGQMTLRFAELDLVGLIDSALARLAPRARDARLALEAALPVESFPVRGDSQRLMQVLVNLVGNAIKFTPASGRVLVRLQPGEVDYQVEVVDTGIGILARDLERIFEKFARLGDSDGDRRKTGESVGLGLPLVKRLVEMHGGRVEVESTPGQGSTFRITLPRNPPPPPAGRSAYLK
jgi:signal transduction histidine kinase